MDLKSLYNALLEAPGQLKNWQDFAAAFRILDFRGFDPQLKKMFVECLEQPIRNHQDLARAGTHLLKLTPGFELAFGPHLLDPLLLGLMHNTLLADPEIEKLLTSTRRYLLTHDWLPEYTPFLEALAVQCERNEFVYSTSEEEERLALSGPPLIQSTYFSKRSLPVGMVETRTQIKNPVSLLVARQYEENPYPQWEQLPLPDPSIYPEATLSAKEILIAGCGTGQQAYQTAEIFPQAHIEAFDLSYISLAYALSKQRGENISFFQADLLELEEWVQKFDLIECSGVLHHLENPYKGWKILRDLLKPNGWMLLGLYSSIGRQDIEAARKAVRGKDLREARQILLELPPAHPAKPVTETIDFYTQSGCRDLLFHAHEVTFNLIEIEEMLNSLNLQFDRFIWRDPELRHKQLSLKEWAAFEKEYPRTFSGMYQFWARPKD